MEPSPEGPNIYVEHKLRRISILKFHKDLEPAAGFFLLYANLRKFCINEILLSEAPLLSQIEDVVDSMHVKVNDWI